VCPASGNAARAGVKRRRLNPQRARQKVWDVESATGEGVLYVGHSKNETSKRKIPLNGAARDAITRMLERADELGTRTRSIISGSRASTTTTTRPSRRRSGMAPGGRLRDAAGLPGFRFHELHSTSSRIYLRPVSPSTLSGP
jgi:hypothetical protein